MQKKVFLSCVTSQLGHSRKPLKQALAEIDVDLRIQEDFTDSASPFGTLVKIYRYMKEVDLVVHLIGSHKPARVSGPEYEELLAVDPGFREWLGRMAILPAADDFSSRPPTRRRP
jgi:hypothetical protein